MLKFQTNLSFEVVLDVGSGWWTGHIWSSVCETKTLKTILLDNLEHHHYLLDWIWAISYQQNLGCHLFSINIYDGMKFIVISLFSHNRTSSINMRKFFLLKVTFSSLVFKDFHFMSNNLCQRTMIGASCWNAWFTWCLILFISGQRNNINMCGPRDTGACIIARQIQIYWVCSNIT